MAFSKNNPYVEKDGSLKFENLLKAAEFEREQELQIRKKLPKAERLRLENIDKHFAEKMQSSIS